MLGRVGLPKAGEDVTGRPTEARVRVEKGRVEVDVLDEDWATVSDVRVEVVEEETRVEVGNVTLRVDRDDWYVEAYGETRAAGRIGRPKGAEASGR